MLSSRSQGHEGHGRSSLLINTSSLSSSPPPRSPTYSRLGSVPEDDIAGLNHHKRQSRHPPNSPSRPSFLPPTSSPPSAPSPPCTPQHRAPPSPPVPFAQTEAILDDLILNPIASTPEPLNTWFDRKKSGELELVHQRRRYRPKMSQQQQQPKSPAAYWGYLISPDHPTQPTPLFRNLLLAIANYIVSPETPSFNSILID